MPLPRNTCAAFGRFAEKILSSQVNATERCVDPAVDYEKFLGQYSMNGNCVKDTPPVTSWW